MTQITINHHEINVVEYKGQRVITFKMIDELHERPEGTAGRNFRENRERFVPGEDYIEVCADEIRRNKIVEISPKAHRDVTLLTSSGYAMLAKSLTDDLSWTIQRELVRSYFKPPVAIPKPKRPRKPPVLTTFKTGYGIAKTLGLDDNQAASHAGRYCLNKCGENPLPALGLDSRPTPTKVNYYNVTELGKELGVSGQAMNKLLIEHGYQVKVHGGSSSAPYEPTEKGKPHARLFDEVRKGSRGSQQVLKWKHVIVSLLHPFTKTPA
ncbi:ORF6N domain-containing protein [Acetobacter pasteurianus]|uniref:ORF6N domain-containing protein n=1 Tax=Acetobacter pasteurianus TaxID=438 RepID=UPI003D142799